jgi:hypothetical protein
LLWLCAASAWAQSAPTAQSSSAVQSSSHKRAAAAKPHHAPAGRAHASPKAAAQPKAVAPKPEAPPKADKPADSKGGHAETSPTVAAPPEQAKEEVASDVHTEGDTQVKVMEFSGLDIEGQLKTPQMLYFLNRLRAEFGRPRLPHRSFMPELEHSTKERSF